MNEFVVFVMVIGFVDGGFDVGCREVLVVDYGVKGFGYLFLMIVVIYCEIVVCECVNLCFFGKVCV